jgi:hypothetical protein
VRFQAEASNFSLPRCVETGSVAHLVPYTVSTGDSAAVKLPGREADHLPPRLRMVELHFHSSIRLHDVVLN